MQEMSLSDLKGRLLAVFGSVAIATLKQIDDLTYEDLDGLGVPVGFYKIQGDIVETLGSDRLSFGQLRTNVENLRKQGNKLLHLALGEEHEPIK